MLKSSALIPLIGIASFSGLLAQEVSFQKPTLLKAAGEHIFVTDPGYAAPSWSDANGDGRGDLVVGQYAEGRVQIFDRNADGTFAKGRWLRAGKDIAQVPDIW